MDHLILCEMEQEVGLNLGVVLYVQISEFKLLEKGVPNLLLTSSKRHGPHLQAQLTLWPFDAELLEAGNRAQAGILCMTKLGPPRLWPHGTPRSSR